MSSYNWPPSSGGGGVIIYPSASDFPIPSTNIGDLAVAADTGGVYEWRGVSWQLLADPVNTPLAITALTGDVTASGPGAVAATLATVNVSPGSFGSASQSLAATVNGKGLITSLSAQSIQIAESQVTNLVSDLAGKQPTGNYITALTGDGTASGPGSSALTLATVNASPGSFGSASTSLSATVNGKGLITSLASQSIQIAESQVTNLVSDLASKVATASLGNLTDVGTDGIVITGGTGAVVGNVSIDQHVADSTHNGYLSSTDWSTFNGKTSGGITALTGDGTASGPGSAVLTLATVNSNVGSFGSSTSIPSFTVNGKGLLTAASGNVVIAPAGTLTGTTLASNVVTSSLTSVGTITSGTWNGTTIAIANGGTGQVTKAAAFDALSPNTTKGDTTIYSSTNVRQAVPDDYGALVPDSTATNGWRKATYTQNLDGKPGKNYIQYADFENNSTTGWTLGTIGTLTNGLPTGSPTFGSGASGNLSLSVISSGQLAGVYSLGYVSSAATTSGNMVASSSYAIDIADQAKVLTVKFNYNIASGATNVNSSGTSSNSYAWAVYDVTNSVWLTSAGNFNLIQNSGVGYCTGTVQTNATTANIRLVIYNANATGGAASVYLDDFYVGPQTSPVGPAMTDLGTISWTPTGSFNTNTTYTGSWKRVGDSMQGYVNMTFSGAPNSTTCTITMPSGYTIDTTKVNSSGSGSNIGGCTFTHSGTVYTGSINVSSSTVIYPDLQTTGAITQASPQTIGNGDNIQFHFIVPIAGWSSNTSMSSDTDTRVIASKANMITAGQTVTTSLAAITLNNVPYDVSGSMSAAGIYTTPVTGFYQLSYGIAIIAGTTPTALTAALKVNGTTLYLLTTTTSIAATKEYALTNSGLIKLNAGDTVQLFAQSSGTASTTDFGNDLVQFSAARVSGPAVIAATESVNARYHASATAVSGSDATVVFSTKDFDSHNAYSTSTGNYTVPVSGKYAVSATLRVLGTYTAANTSSSLSVYKNTVQYSQSTSVTAGSISQTFIGVSINDLVSCNAGDVIAIKVSSSATGPSLDNGNEREFFSIERVGN